MSVKLFTGSVAVPGNKEILVISGVFGVDNSNQVNERLDCNAKWFVVC